MGLNIEKLSKNPKVKKVTANSIRLTTEFRIEMFKLFKAGKTEEIKDVLIANGLGDEYVYNGYFSVFINGLEANGYPVSLNFLPFSADILMMGLTARESSVYN